MTIRKRSPACCLDSCSNATWEQWKQRRRSTDGEDSSYLNVWHLVLVLLKMDCVLTVWIPLLAMLFMVFKRVCVRARTRARACVCVRVCTCVCVTCLVPIFCEPEDVVCIAWLLFL